MKKKILVVSHNFYPENFPINNVIKNLNINKFDIYVLTGKPNYPQGKIYKGYNPYFVNSKKIQSNIKVYHVPIFPRLSGGYFLILNYISFILSGIIFGTFIFFKKKINLIFIYTPSPVIHALVGIFFKKVKKSKIVIWLQDIWPNSLIDTGFVKNKIVIKLLKIVVKYIYQESDLILCQSPEYRNYLKKNSIKTNSEVLYNPPTIDLKKKSIKLNNIKIPKLNSKNINIVYTGNIGYAQPFKNILKVFQNLKNKKIKLYLIGEGQYKKKLKNNIKYNNLSNIILVNYIKEKNLSFILKRADYLLLCLKNKYSFNLTIPSKFQNYLLFKKPLICMASGITYKIINKSNLGYCFKPNENFKLKKFLDKLSKEKNNKNLTLISNCEKYLKKECLPKIIYKKLNLTLLNILEK